MKLILLFLLVIALIIGLPILLSILGFRWLKRKGYKKTAMAIPILILGTLFYFIYSAFYPDEDFYVQDFESNTNVFLPESASFIKKDATFPDIHGSYTSKAIIRLSPKDYKHIYQKLSADSMFRVDTSSYHFVGDTIEFFEAKGIEISKINTLLIGVRKDQFKIGFVNDGKTIVFEQHSN